MKITKTIAKKVLSVVDAGLASGVGKPIPGKMCVEAAVCFALGLPHGDEPGCVSPALRRFKIGMNDAYWSSNESRAKGLRRLAVAQLGTKNTLDEVEFVSRLAKLAAKYAAESAKYAAQSAEYSAESAAQSAEYSAEYAKYAKYAAKYAEYAANSAKYAAESAEYAAKSAEYAANSAKYAAESAEYAAQSAEYAAQSAEYAANSTAEYAANSTAEYAKKDKVLSDFCEDVVKILIDMNAVGTQWLYITE